MQDAVLLQGIRTCIDLQSGPGGIEARQPGTEQDTEWLGGKVGPGRCSGSHGVSFPWLLPATSPLRDQRFESG